MNESTEISSPMILSSHSRASDTSSAYSGSDIMQSSTNGDEPIMMNNDTDEESEDSDDVSLDNFTHGNVFECNSIVSHHFRFVIMFEMH